MNIHERRMNVIQHKDTCTYIYKIICNVDEDSLLHDMLFLYYGHSTAKIYVVRMYFSYMAYILMAHSSLNRL